MFIKIVDDTPEGHPILEENFSSIFPQIAHDASPVTVHELGYAVIQAADQPETATSFHLVKVSDGLWAQVWISEPADRQGVDLPTALKQIDDLHAAVLQKLVGNPTQAERDTWDMKLETANAVVSGRVISAAGQAFLGSAGIVDHSVWAQTVIAKSAAFAHIVGVGERLRNEAKAAVKAATTNQEVAAAMEASTRTTEQLVTQFLQRMAANG